MPIEIIKVFKYRDETFVLSRITRYPEVDPMNSLYCVEHIGSRTTIEFANASDNPLVYAKNILDVLEKEKADRAKDTEVMV